MTDTPHFVLRGGELWRSPWADYRALRDRSPVHRVDDPRYGEYFVLSRFTDVFDAARDPTTFSSAGGLTPDPNDMAMFEGQAAPIVMQDPPDQTVLRRIVSKPMTPRHVASTEAEIQAFVDERLDELDGSGDTDIVDALFKPLPSTIVAHYLRVPMEDRTRFDRWTDAIVAANAGGDLASAPEAALELFEYANELIDRRTREPADDLVSLLVAAGDDLVSREWVVGFVFTMVAGGNDTTTGLLGGAAALLTDHPDQRRLLIEDPSCTRPAVDEFLRLTSPVQNLARTTTRDVVLHDVEIPAGRKVLLLYGAANRDEREFGPTSEALDVLRPIARHVAFSYGPHHCLGAAAARLAGAVTIERLLDRFPRFAVDSGAGRFAPGPFVRRYESLPFRTRA